MGHLEAVKQFTADFCMSQVPRQDVVLATSVLSGKQSQRTTSGGMKRRMAHPTLKWMTGTFFLQPESLLFICLLAIVQIATMVCLTAWGAMQDVLAEPREGSGLPEHVGPSVCL